LPSWITLSGKGNWTCPNTSEDNEGNYRIQLAKKPKQKTKKQNFETK
jgi:hypothetical protein